MEPGVADALGTDALIYSKPGWVPENCVDVGLVVDPSSGQRVLFGIASPDDGGPCATLAEVAGIALAGLAR